MKEYNATLIDYGEGKGKLVVESEFGKVTFAVKADSHMWVELERPHGEWTECNVKNIFGETMKAYECSSCKRKNIGDVWIMMKLNFCPNCGASMISSNSEIEKSKSEIVPDYRDGWRLKEGEEK